MSFGKGSNSTTNTSAPNPQAMQAYQDLLTRAGGVADTPYQAYAGQMVAPINDQQRRGFAGINDNAGFAQPYVQQAAGWVEDAANPISGADVEHYMSPYTQQVVDATSRQFQNTNAQQQQQVVGNAVAQNALGGDRVGVAQATLAGQQQTAQAPVIAGLYNQGYSQALEAAQRDRANKSNAAYAMGNLGVAGQQAALTGAGAQVGAGTLEQQTSQSMDTAQFQEFLRQQAYPFQTAQWLAGLSTGVGSQMGGTSTTDPPDPNPWSQALGLGISAGAMFLSDERAKENIERVGSLNDGQPIYRFNYKGDPRTQIGLIAQDVEKSHPEAVANIGGVGAVDYRAATDDAAERRYGGPVRHFDNGGGISGTPYAGVAGYVPRLAITPGSGAPRPPSASQQDGGTGKMAGAAMDLAEKLKGKFSGVGDPISLAPSGVGGVDLSNANTFVGPTQAGPSISGLFRDGGMVLPQANRIDLRRPGFDSGGMAGFGTGSVLPDSFADRFSPPEDRFAASQFDPPTDIPGFVPSSGVLGDIPQSPMTAGLGMAPQTEPPPQVASQAVEAAPPAPEAQEDVELTAQAPADVGGPSFTPETPQAGVAQQEASGSGLLNLSPAARQGLLAAGLAMMASRSPNLGVAIGEGGLHGIASYQGAKKSELDTRKVEADIDEGKKRLELSAKNASERLKLDTKRLDQQRELHNTITPYQRAQLARENQKLIGINEEGFPVYLDTRSGTESVGATRLQGKVDKGYVRNPDGTMSPVKGGPADPEVIKAVAAAKQGAPLAEDTADFLAERVIAGDSRALIGLGRGAQGSQNISKIQAIVAAKARERGMDATDLLAKTAEQSGLTAQQRTFGTQVARMAINATEAQGAIKLGREASGNVPRGDWVPVNRAIQAYQSGTSNPALAKFGAANLAIVNTYARAISPTGVPIVHDKEHAEKLLSTATGPDAYNALLDQMNAEINIAHAAPRKAKQELEDIRKGRAPETAEPGAQAKAPARPASVPAGSMFSPSRNLWRGPDGKIYNADGSPKQ